MLGHKLIQILSKKFDVLATIRENPPYFERYNFIAPEKIFGKINVEDFDGIEKIVLANKPDVVINAAGVIKQIADSKDVEKTLKVNSIFPHQLAKLTSSTGKRLITVSTDCVFSGRKGNYHETDIPDAEDLYGKSKNLGEVVESDCLTLRASIIGRELQTGHSLVEWFLSRRNQTIKGFKKAIFSGFPTIVFSEIIADIIENQKNLQGLYHVSSEPINKFDLLTLLKRFYKIPIEIEPDEEFAIDRSLDSTKFRSETGFKPPGWEKMVELMARDLTPYDSFKETKIILK